ncbi:MAG: hypothetical protein M3Y82_14550 [Verrucomicrobiota bacterium]|nr:hypothetical protein [Verrucomicrobiota bacterium]
MNQNENVLRQNAKKNEKGNKVKIPMIEYKTELVIGQQIDPLIKQE